MAVNVNGSIKLLANIADIRTIVTGAAAEVGRIDNSLEAGWLVQPGTAAGLGDKVWSDTRTVADGGTSVIDLNGVLTDAFGAIVTFAKLRAIAIAAAATNTTTLQLARPGTAVGVPLFAAMSDALAPLSAGGFACWSDPAAGVVVTAATADLIHVINSAGAIATFTVILVGTSA
jgi:hypothetical protein